MGLLCYGDKGQLEAQHSFCTKTSIVKPFSKSRGTHDLSLFRFKTSLEDSGIQQSFLISILTSLSSICEALFLAGEEILIPSVIGCCIWSDFLDFRLALLEVLDAVY